MQTLRNNTYPIPIRSRHNHYHERITALFGSKLLIRTFFCPPLNLPYFPSLPASAVLDLMGPSEILDIMYIIYSETDERFMSFSFLWIFVPRLVISNAFYGVCKGGGEIEVSA